MEEGLTYLEELQLIKLLSKIGPKFSSEVFNAMASILRLPAFEIILLRKGPYGQEVLLQQRPENDVHFPYQFHSPGTIARLSDATQGDTLKRLARTEFGDENIAKQAVLAGINFSRHARGGEVHIIHYAFANKDQKTKGTWFPVDQLPKPFMEHHRPLIKTALEKSYQ